MHLRLLAALCGFSLALTAGTSQLLTNGGFEAGDLSGWTVTDTGGAGSFFASNDPFTPFSGNPTNGAAGGSFYAVSDQFGPGSHALTQSFVDPIGTTTAILSFNAFVNDWVGGQFGGEVDLLAGGADPVIGTPLFVFYNADTSVANGIPNPWMLTSLDIAGLLTGGNSYQIRVLESDSSGPLNMGADNFSLLATNLSTVPEPGTFLPVALVGALILVASQLRKTKWSAVFFSVSALFGQSRPLRITRPMVRAGSIASGYARPHVWVLAEVPPTRVHEEEGRYRGNRENAMADVTPSGIHGPGDPNCGTTDQCYYYPIDFTTAYGTNFIQNSNGGQGRTVAIVDAFYDSQTESDLASFNSAMGLAPCTVSSGCLTIVSQTGGAPIAGFNPNWGVETDLDVQWVHGIAPKAKILLVTATTNSFSDLGTAELYAQAHADVVSNSWGSLDSEGEPGLDFYWSGSSVPILFSSGDTGAKAEYPCTSPYVLCVGGTSMVETSTSHRNTEFAWSGSGGGCTSNEPAPAWQTGFTTACGSGRRGVPDIAGPADPNTGAVIYLGTRITSSPGLYTVGGTSWACPVTAAVVALIDNSRAALSKSLLGSALSQQVYQAAANPYYNYRLYDVKTGSSGFPAVTGWDRATGLGVPLGAALAAYLVSLP